MRILAATSELHPYSKTGGLADMVAGLSNSLAEQGHEVRIVTPLYKCVRESVANLKPFDWKMQLPLGAQTIEAKVWTIHPRDNLTIYFIDQPDFFNRDGLYQTEQGGFPDNPDRFIFFSKAVTHLARYLDWRPDILHLHDWQSALIPLLVRHQSTNEGWENPPATCLTIHNLAYQGVCDKSHFDNTNLPWDHFTPDGVEFFGSINFLKAGIVYSDWVSTVSRKYASEILTPEFGCGLEAILTKRISTLSGILNGVDYGEWNTTDNPFIPFQYSAGNLDGKSKNKMALQRSLGLKVDSNVPFFGTISRLAEQKGLHLLIKTLRELDLNQMQFVLLGTGDVSLANQFNNLAKEFPQNVAIHIGYDRQLAHLIEAGTDFFVMPSLYEPCGLNQLYSLRYGSIPIVRATGGLDDTIQDIDSSGAPGTGLKFLNPLASELTETMRRALRLYPTSNFKRCQLMGMKQDYSWNLSAKSYANLFTNLCMQNLR